MLKNNVYDRLREKSRQFEKDGQIIFANEYRSIYRLMMNLLDELVELMGTEMVTFHEYAELLGAGISEGLVGFIPPASHEVVVGDVRRTRLKNVKVLFFLGVNDDCIPKSAGRREYCQRQREESLLQREYNCPKRQRKKLIRSSFICILR